MRGRKPHEFFLDDQDRAVLERIARSQTRPWFQVERARVLLAIAAGQRIQELAQQRQCGRTTIWRIRRRYAEHGLEGVLSQEPRPGHPPRISPPATSANRGIGLLGAYRQRAAHHPLDQ